MRKLENKINSKAVLKCIKVKTGTVEDFFSNIKEVMHAADQNKSIKQEVKTLTFIEPKEMLQFLSDTKIKLIKSIRRHPDTITNIAKIIKRNRASVYRDVNELEKFGLVKTHEAINPGHGRYKMIELVAPMLKLEAYI